MSTHRAPTPAVRPWPAPAALLCALALAGCAAEGCFPEPRAYDAEIRRTAYGVPHIVARDFGSLAFGQGYAFAEDNACVLADQVLKVKGERARFFGRGEGDAHVDSDFAYRHLALHEVASEALARQTPEARELIRGYAAGYNAYLAEAGASALPEGCRDAAWVRPISELDLMAYYVDLSLLGSTRQLLPLIARAEPPYEGALRSVPASFPDLRRPGMGSNGWAVGEERSANGGGLLVGNPHFPWEGELKLGEVHLTVPGELNVYGATLMGVVGVLVGFNESLAWTHTVSFAPRMTLYELALHEADPTAYLYDDEARPMTSQEHTIEVRSPGGTLTEERRTLWRTHWGPMLDMPLYGWASDMAFTYRDVNLENHGFIEQFRRVSLARSVEELKQAYDEVQGVPWVHTIAVDKNGDTLYADASTVPNVSGPALEKWLHDRQSAFFTRTLYEQGAVLLGGRGRESEWITEPGAARPGIVPFAAAPALVRRDFVANANDNHWLPNPASPLEGFSPLYGDERAPLGPRTRMNLRHLLELFADEAPLTREELTAAILSNRGLHADLVLDEALARCEGEPLDVGAACEVLASWDRRYDEGSVGAVLFRELLGAFGHAAMKQAGPFYALPFDPDDPVHTPRGLAAAPDEGEDPLLGAIAEAVARLEHAGLPLDAALGEAQRSRHGDDDEAIHGGTEMDAVANIVGRSALPSTADREPLEPLLVEETGLAEGGYPINYGASFLFAVSLDEGGPSAEALLLYGQAGDPASPHRSDQLELYQAKALRPVLFREEDIAADPELRERTVAGTDEGL